MKRVKCILLGVMVVLIVAILIAITRKTQTSRFRMHTGESRERSSDGASKARSERNEPGEVKSAGKAAPARWEKSPEDPRDMEAEARALENPPYELRGNGGTGWVVDRAGNVLLKSGDKIAIFDAKMSPDNEHILVVGGGKGSLVLTPSTSTKMRLPARPPGKNVMGFDWYWIDAANLLGVGATNALDENGQPVKGDDNVGETRLYIFNICRQELAGLPLPREVKTPVIAITERGRGGYVHVVEGVSNGREGDDLGWFKIVPQGSFEK